jgi:hypothetical protein
MEEVMRWWGSLLDFLGEPHKNKTCALDEPCNDGDVVERCKGIAGIKVCF